MGYFYCLYTTTAFSETMCEVVTNTDYGSRVFYAVYNRFVVRAIADHGCIKDSRIISFRYELRVYYDRKRGRIY